MGFLCAAVAPSVGPEGTRADRERERNRGMADVVTLESSVQPQDIVGLSKRKRERDKGEGGGKKVEIIKRGAQSDRENE